MTTEREQEFDRLDDRRRLLADTIAHQVAFSGQADSTDVERFRETVAAWEAAAMALR